MGLSEGIGLRVGSPLAGKGAGGSKRLETTLEVVEGSSPWWGGGGLGLGCIVRWVAQVRTNKIVALIGTLMASFDPTCPFTLSWVLEV